MSLFKVHIVAISIAFFLLGVIASSAMAHCGHDSFAAEGSISLEISGHQNHDAHDAHDGHSDKADAASCGSHGHGSAALTIGASDHVGGGHGSNQVDCDDCFGASCQSKVQIPQGIDPAQCIELDEVHSQSTIHVKDIFLTIIPDPPNKVS